MRENAKPLVIHGNANILLCWRGSRRNTKAECIVRVCLRQSRPTAHERDRAVSCSRVCRDRTATAWAAGSTWPWPVITGLPRPTRCSGTVAPRSGFSPAGVARSDCLDLSGKAALWRCLWRLKNFTHGRLEASVWWTRSQKIQWRKPRNESSFSPHNSLETLSSNHLSESTANIRESSPHRLRLCAPLVYRNLFASVTHGRP